MTPADAPFGTVEELIACAQANPLNHATQSSMSRLIIGVVGAREGVNRTGFPTKGGGETALFLLAERSVSPGQAAFTIAMATI